MPSTFRFASLLLTGFLALAACERAPAPSPPPVIDPDVPGPARPEDRPTLSPGAVSSTPSSLTVSFTVSAAPGTLLESCEVSGAGGKKTLTLGGVSTAVRTVTLEGLNPGAPYTVRVECRFKDAQNRLGSGTLSLDARTAEALPEPPASEGGNKPPTDPSFDPLTDYAWVTLEQVTPSGERRTLRYLRGSFALSEVLPEGYDYFLTTTVTNPGNAITGRINSALLAQGLSYTLLARGKAGSSEAGKVVATFEFVPDNLGPQGADVQPGVGAAGGGYLSSLPGALTSRYGNWVGGGARPSGFEDSAARFTLRLSNTRRLEDTPAPGAPGPVNPGGGVPQHAVGVATLRYFALPVASGFVGDLAQALSGEAVALLLGERSSNDVSGDPALNNYPVLVQTVQGDTLEQDGVAQLGDGGGASRYLVYAVASDRLGNPSLNRDRRSSSYNASGYPFVIVNVDNTAPTVTAPTLRDRGPLDVNAQGEGCERVDALEAPLAAPSDVFPAEEGFASGCALVSASVADSGVGFDSARVVNTSGTLIGLGTPSSGISSGRLGLKITARGAATLPPTVVNLNDLSGLQTFTLTGASDLLGNVAESQSGSISVDHVPPGNLTLSVASANGGNTFVAGQPIGLSSSGEDRLSGLRQAGDVAALSLWVGSDPASDALPETLRENPFAHAAVRIAPAEYANYALPFPAAQRLTGSMLEGELNVWTLGVDRAGNAAAGLETLSVRAGLPNGWTPAQGLTPLKPRLAPDVGSSETGTPKHPYAGFTVLNYNEGGVVPQGMRDALEPGPLTLGGKLNDYTPLPQTGPGETGLYRLTLPDADLRSSGDAWGEPLGGTVSFLSRLADPITAVDPSSATPVTQVNPATVWPNASRAEQNTARSGSFRYNLPQWTRLPLAQQIGHLWNPIWSGSGRPYQADVSTGSVGEAAVAMRVTNTHGFSSVQSKK